MAGKQGKTSSLRRKFSIDNISNKTSPKPVMSQDGEGQQPEQTNASTEAEIISKQIQELSEKMKEISPQNPKRTTEISEKTLTDISKEIGYILENLKNFSENFQKGSEDRGKIDGYIYDLDSRVNATLKQSLKNKTTNGKMGYNTLFNSTFNSYTSDTGKAFSNAIKGITSILNYNKLENEFERIQDDIKKEAVAQQPEQTSASTEAKVEEQQAQPEQQPEQGPANIAGVAEAGEQPVEKMESKQPSENALKDVTPESAPQTEAQTEAQTEPQTSKGDIQDNQETLQQTEEQQPKEATIPASEDEAKVASENVTPESAPQQVEGQPKEATTPASEDEAKVASENVTPESAPQQVEGQQPKEATIPASEDEAKEAPKDVTPKTPTPEDASENVTPNTSSASTSISDALKRFDFFQKRNEKATAEEETRKKEEIVLKQVIQILSGKEITDENGKKVEANKVSFYTDTMPQNEKILDTIWIPTINRVFEEKVGVITLKISKIKEIGETIRKNIQIAEKEGFKIPEDQKKKIEDAITKKEEEHIKKTYESVKFKISSLVPEGNLDKLDETKKEQITEIFYKYEIKDEKQIDRFIKEVNAEKNRERAAEELRKTPNERNNARKNNVADNQQTNAKTVGPQQPIDTVQQPKQADTQQQPQTQPSEPTNPQQQADATKTNDQKENPGTPQQPQTQPTEQADPQQQADAPKDVTPKTPTPEDVAHTQPSADTAEINNQNDNQEKTQQASANENPRVTEDAQQSSPTQPSPETEQEQAGMSAPESVSEDVAQTDTTQEQPAEQQADIAQEATEQILGWKEAHENYATAIAEYQTASNNLSENLKKIVGNDFKDVGYSPTKLSEARNKLLKDINQKYNPENKGEPLSYDDLIKSLQDKIETGKNIDRNGIDEQIKKAEDNLKKLDGELKQAEKNKRKTDKNVNATEKTKKKLNDLLTSLEKSIKENDKLIESDNIDNTLKDKLQNLRQNNSKFLTEINTLIKTINNPDNLKDLNFEDLKTKISEQLTRAQATVDGFYKEHENQEYFAGKQFVLQISSEANYMQLTVEQMQKLAKQKEAQQEAQKKLEEAQRNHDEAQNKLNTLKNAKNTSELQQNINDIKQIKDFDNALAQEQIALKQLNTAKNEAYIKELVNRLTGNDWSQEKVEITAPNKKVYDLTLNGEMHNLTQSNNKEVAQQYMKQLLVKALKRIYTSDNENGKELRKQLSLGNDLTEEEKEIFTPTNLFMATVEKNFNSYQSELFAEKQPKQMTVNLANIVNDINDIVKTFKIEQIKQQIAKPTNFQNIVTERAESFQKIFEEEGAAKCREKYEKNLNNKEEHELDVLALSKLPKETFDKIAPWGLIHGIYGQIKKDQKGVNGDNIEKLLTEHRRHLITNEDTHFIRKPKEIKAFDIAENIIKYPNSENTRKALKFLCQQQDRSEAWPKSKGKWHGNMLNAVVENLEKNTFKDAAILKDAFQEIVNDETQGFSITKPMEDKMVYFKIVYTYATEDARNELLENPGFIKQVEKLSKEKKEKLGYFFELIEEGKKDSIKQLNLQQQKSTKNQSLTDDEMVDYVDEHGFDVGIIQGSALNKETLTPYYLFDENGNSNKNNENLLGKVNFKLQDSFLGLACAEDRKAGVLKNNTRAKKVRDENGNKIKDKSQRVTGEQVQQQREAEKAAQEAVKRAGGNLKTITEKTMPLLKNTEFKFRINGKEVSLGEAVKVCLKVLQKRQQREQILGISQGRIPEKNLMDQVGSMLNLNVENGYFSKKELQSIREAISAQIIATNAFTETFNGKNQALANKLENGREQVMQNQQEEVRQQSTDNALGGLQIINNGQELGATLTVDKSKFKEQINQQAQDLNQSQPTPSNSGGLEADSSIESSTKLEAGSQPNIQQGNGQSPKDGVIIGGLANGFKQKANPQQTQENIQQQNMRISFAQGTNSKNNKQKNQGRYQ